MKNPEKFKSEKKESKTESIIEEKNSLNAREAIEKIKKQKEEENIEIDEYEEIKEARKQAKEAFNEKENGDKDKEKKALKEKKLNWKKRLKRVDNLEDRIGCKVDDKIKETIIAFWSFDVPTSGSCEGHISHGVDTPWIDVEALNRPKKRFVGEVLSEEEIVKKASDEYKISPKELMDYAQEVKRGIHKEGTPCENAWQEAVKELSQREETPEYKKWKKKTEELKKKISGLLKEFYDDRKVDSHIRLRIRTSEGGPFRVKSEASDFSQKDLQKDLTKKQKEEFSKQLIRKQEEMKEFTSFLKDKYFSA